MKIGVLGAGQLGQMLALSGYPLGNRFSFFDTTGSPSAEIGETICDQTGARLAEFLSQVDLVTYEFEHLPLELVKQVAQHKPLFPSVEALGVCQNREAEKALFDRLTIPVAPYRLVNSAEELALACQQLMAEGAPAVVAKSITEGYDGKGQAVLRDPSEADEAWTLIGHSRLIVEAFVSFVREVSIIAVRGRSGDVVFYPLAENHHSEGILRYSLAPLPDVTDAIQQQAEGYIHQLLDSLNYVGVLTLELFQCADGTLLANEMAPRVHNSGHWTQNGAMTSQFENHLRAVQGLPLGSTQAIQPTCMINIIGQLGDTQAILGLKGAHLHLYGKSERAGRKLGHINVVADDLQSLMTQVHLVSKHLPNAPKPKFTCV